MSNPVLYYTQNIAQPKGEVDHGAVLDMCDSMCGQYSGADFGDFELGDLLGTILGGLQDSNFKVDPFLTNLARGIVAMEGTIKTLSPKVNILNYFTDKVNVGFDFNLDLEHPENMNPEIAMLLAQLAKGAIDSTTKTAEALDMLEKGQIKVNTEFGIDDKALKAINHITGYVIRALVIVALFIGSCLMCTAPVTTEASTSIWTAIPAIGFIGYVVSVFFMYRLYKDIKNGK